ncbi:MAG: DNA polymerase I [Planctomycetota bacterium]|nr:DNA polymerase I [Planctomycetota bacterium]
MPTLYLIDGYAQFFRNYHAIRTPMTSPVTKEPTNMTFGFVGMLLKLLRGQGNLAGPPDFLAVALDISGDRETFRSEIYPEYKANRSAPPEDLQPQVERCLAMLRELGVPVLGAPGYEADDAIATIVKRLSIERPDVTIRLVSKDKDLKQLLRDAGPEASTGAQAAGQVQLFDVHTDQAFTAESLRTETGLRPEQVFDMLVLMGDNVDNVPGAEGVGEKTAAALIQQFGSVDELARRADEIKGKRGEKIRAFLPQLDLVRSLIRLRDDVPLDFSLESADTSKLRLEKLLPILKELGFNRYQDELRAIINERTGQSLTFAGATSGDGPPRRPDTGRPDTPDGLLSSAAPAPPMWAAALPQPTGQPAGDPRAQPPPTRRRAEPDASPQLGLFGVDRPALQPRPALGAYRCITSERELSGLVEQLRDAPILALDTETTDISPTRASLCGISISTAIGSGFYIPVRSPSTADHLDERRVVDALRPVLEDPDKPKCGHNLKYDLVVLRRAGIRVALGRFASLTLGDALVSQVRGQSAPTSDRPASFDSMVASYLVDSSRSSHGLEALSLALLQRGKQSLSELLGSGRSQTCFDTLPLDVATNYAAADADLALSLRDVLLPQLRVMGLLPLFDNVEMPLVGVLAELELSGILLDVDELERQRRRLQSQISAILDKLASESKQSIHRTFDPDSPKQLAAALFHKPEDDPPGLGIKPTKRTKTGYSTDAEVLEDLVEDASITTPIPALVLEYRQLAKLVSTYLVALREEVNPDTGRVHTSFHQTVAATGRLASSDPNLQNIPIRTDIGREIRRAFVAPPGHLLVTADYSQIELRLLAHLSRDPALIQAFLSGQDIHAQVAAQIHGVPLDQVTREQRGGAKMVNFGIVYGITSFGLARRLGIPEKEAATIITGYKKRFSGITTFLHECVDQARSYGYVETLLKRRRPIPDIDSKNPSRRAFAERTAINSVVQGSAADLIKLAMVDLRRAAEEAGSESPLGRARMLLQIHDELVFECPEVDAPAVRDVVRGRMEAALTLSVPLKADAHIAANWFDGK